MFKLTDIFPLSDFQRRTREHVRRLRATGRPEVLTVNGRAELVVYCAESYEAVAETLERARRHVEDQSRLADSLEPDPVIEEYKRDVDRTLLRANLLRTVQERVENLVALQRLASEARRVGAQVR